MKLKNFIFAALAAAFVLAGCEPEQNPEGGKINKPATTINKVTVGGTFNVLGTVAASGNDAFVISDATGVMFVYMKGHDAVVGEQVLVEGQVTQEYGNNAPQMSPTKITKTGKTFTPSYNPKAVDADDVVAYLASGKCACEDIEIRGVVTFSEGKYINLVIKGCDSQGSIKYKSLESLADFEGKSVVVKGFLQTTYNYLGVLPYSVELDPDAKPFIASLSESALQFAPEGESKVVEVGVSVDEGWTMTAEVDADGFGVVVEGKNVTVTAPASTGRVQTVMTITLKNGDSVLDQKEVLISQAAPLPSGSVVIEKVVKDLGYANAQSVDGQAIVLDDCITLTFNKAKSGTAPAYYDSGEAIRMYQNGATLLVKAAEGKSIFSIELTFADNHYYLAPDKGELSEEGPFRVWSGDASEVLFTSTGTDKSHRAYISKIKVSYK